MSGTPRGSAAPGTTAVVALLPVADPLLELAAARDPRAVRPGVPAHAALLYPFLPADRFTPPELADLAARVRGTGPLTVRLAGTQQHGGFAAVELPDLRPLATAVRSGWPDVLPYGGRFGDDPPVHLTVALGTDPATAELIARDAAARLPLEQHLTEVHVAELDAAGWRLRAALALG